MQIIKKIIKKNINIFKNQNASEISVLSSLKKRPQAPYDFLSRYETILKRTINWQSLNFINRNVFELGCGPHLGFGPLAIFLGAKNFIAADPTTSYSVFDSEQLRETYFRVLYKDLEALYGPRISFTEYFLNLKNKTILYNNSKDALDKYNNKIDIQITNSCLEHIDDISSTLKDLKILLSNKGRYLHGIDFGNHRKTINPFEGIYNKSKKDYQKIYGNKINLLTPSEILTEFNNAGFHESKIVPYFFAKEGFKGNIHDDWIKRLNKEDYFLKFALLAGPF